MNTALQLELSERASERYAQRVNPEWVRLLDLLQMNVRYERCVGAELFTDEGNCILDFLSGYCVHNVGHNHPHVVRALRDAGLMDFALGVAWPRGPAAVLRPSTMSISSFALAIRRLP